MASTTTASVGSMTVANTGVVMSAYPKPSAPLTAPEKMATAKKNSRVSVPTSAVTPSVMLSTPGNSTTVATRTVPVASTIINSRYCRASRFLVNCLGWIFVSSVVIWDHEPAPLSGSGVWGSSVNRAFVRPEFYLGVGHLSFPLVDGDDLVVVRRLRAQLLDDVVDERLPGPLLDGRIRRLDLADRRGDRRPGVDLTAAVVCGEDRHVVVVFEDGVEDGLVEHLGVF